ncbi:MAG: hypothetical protein RR232_06360 [Clostridia bacterium]
MIKQISKDLDILSAYRTQIKDKERKTVVRRALIGAVVAVLLMAMGGFYIMIQTQKRAVSSEIDSVQAELNSPEALERAEQIQILNDRLRRRLEYNDILKTHLTTLGATYRPTSALFADIERVSVAHNVECTALTYLDERVVLECNSKSGSAAALFAKALEDKLMQGVYFYGYSWMNGVDHYGFAVQGMRRGE